MVRATWASFLGLALACAPSVSVAEIGTIIELEVAPSGKQFAVISATTKEEFDERSEPASHLWLVDATGRRVLSVPEPIGMVMSVSFVPGADKVLYALLLPDEIALIKEYEPATNEIRTVAVASHWNVHSLQCAPDGKQFGYVDSGNHTLVIVDPQDGSSRVVADAVFQWHWCWSGDGKSVFYATRRSVCRQQLDDPDQMVELFIADESHDPCLIIASPDGRSIGFEAGKSFHTIELTTSEAAKRFYADHYFHGYSWNPSGICYLDRSGAERERKADLMVYDLATNRERRVATGGFAYPRWISNDEIVVRQGNSEVWKYHVKTLAGEKLFPLP